MAIKPKDLKFEEAALRKRIDFVRNLKLALQNRESITAQTVHVYTLIIDEIIKEVALEVHRAVKTGQDDLKDVIAASLEEKRQKEEEDDGTGDGVATPLPSPTLTALPLGVQMGGSKGGKDMYGNHIPPIALDQVECPSCGRHVAAGRFAPHLEKCMGLGRQASRNAARRLADFT